jgi:hypothetical protein
MSSTFTIRISKELKEKMKNFKVEWSKEVREFIESRVRQLMLAEKIKDVEIKARKRRVKVDSTNLIREDREH